MAALLEPESKPTSGTTTLVEPPHQTNDQPFVGRMGGNQNYVVDNSTADIEELEPDAAPYMSWQAQMSLHGFRNPNLWKAAAMEGMGTLMLVYLTVWMALSPAQKPVPPTLQLGQFNSAAFIGPLIGGISNCFLITLFIYMFGAVSGGHVNPLITIGTFFARLCTLPRMCLYVAFQTAGGGLAGLLVRASIGTRQFKVGGCFVFTDIVPVHSAFILELMLATLLLFVAFGVGLDPRQRQIIGPALSPFLVGMGVAVLSFGSAFTRYGYGGASLNPARCFGAFVGSEFGGYHWVHWAADIIACIIHGLFYGLIPPWKAIA